MIRWLHELLAGVAVAFALVPMTASAADLAWSGYGTLGYARSDRDYAYQRTITNEGTFLRDSVLGLQLDAKLDEQFSATLQVKAAQASDHDHAYRPSVAWAFLAYRPSNDWLFRLGKQRIPVYLFSETYDVGVTYEFARLPTEMYSLVASNDFVGASFSRSWSGSNRDFVLDGYAGVSSNDFRVFARDTIPGVWQRGPIFLKLKFKGGGLVLSWKQEALVARIGVHYANIRSADGTGLASDYPYVAELGYFQVFDDMPGPGVRRVRDLPSIGVTLGVDVGLPGDVRVISEVAHSVASRSDYAPQGRRGYVSALRTIGNWTPYVGYAAMRSSRRTLAAYAAVNGNALPATSPEIAFLNATQRAGADGIVAFDQSSWSLGTSYAFSAKSKLKAEVMRTRIGAVSNLVDAPEGGNVRHQSINVFSLSYSFVY